VIYKAQGNLDLAIKSYSQAVGVNPMLHEGYNSLGLCLQDQGDLSPALKNFQAAIKLQPDYTDAIYNRINILKDVDDFANAVSCLQDLIKIDPSYNRAQHLYALTGRTTPIPTQEYVESLFEEYAPHIEQDLIHNLHYTAPRRLVDALLHLSTQKNLGSVSDLGCGTGLIGSEVNRFASYIEGVDLSKSIVAQAERKNTYDRLIVLDINACLAKTAWILTVS
jgi:predicted TPR repeat methyltransferase